MRPVERMALPNGLRVAVVSVPGLRSAVALLALEAGQWSEPPDRAGVARLTARSLLRGTAARDATAWSTALDDLGAAARVDVGAHAATFSGQCLAPDLAPYLSLVAEAVTTPALGADQVEFVRAETLAEIEEDSRDTRAVADRTWRALAYPPEHPFHHRAIGSEQVVRALTTDDVALHHRTSVAPDAAVLVIVGGVEASAAFEAAAAGFGDWRGTAAPLRERAPVALATRARREEALPDKTQSDIVLGWLGLPRTDPRFVAARVTNMVFAADTFASRTGRIVRDDLGLAYYVHSVIGTSRGQSPWALRMGVNPENVDRAIGVVTDELAKLHAGDIASDDLELARDKMVGELDVALESPAGIAQMVLEAELFGLGEDHFERYPRALRAVTKDDVIATAREFLPLDRYALAIAGPAEPGRAAG